MGLRIICGQRADGTHGLDIGRPGFDLEGKDPLTHPDHYAFSSKWNRLEKIIAAGTTTVSFGPPAGTQFLDLSARGIGYYPLVDAHLRHRSSGRIEDHGWYKYDYSGADPSYSNRWQMRYGKSDADGTRIVQFYGYRDGVDKRPLDGTWDITWVIWDNAPITPVSSQW